MESEGGGKMHTPKSWGTDEKGNKWKDQEETALRAEVQSAPGSGLPPEQFPPSLHAEICTAHQVIMSLGLLLTSLFTMPADHLDMDC